jgi:predicted DCC family thiol-disulfide oxidoreductase YuxK
MVGLREQGEDGPHLILYDGVCGLCNRLIRFVLAHDSARLFRFASLQSAAARSALGPSGLSPNSLTTFYLLPNHGRNGSFPLDKSRAALFVMIALGWPWKAAAILGILPTSMADRLYDIVARNRCRLFGRQEQCELPLPEHRSRFTEM